MGGVLLLDAHLKQALVVTRSLGGRDISVTAGSHRHWTPSRFSKHAERSFRYPNPDNEAAFLEAIKTELTASDYDMLLPIEESTLDVVLRNREELEALAALPFPPTETVRVGLDKRRTIETARRHGVAHPETLFSASATIPDVEATLSYPIVVKPVNGEGRLGVSVCHSPEALRKAASETIDEYGPVLFQEFIPNGGEYGVYALYDHAGELRGLTVQRRLRSKPPEGGASTYRETVEMPALVSVADDFLTALEWEGAVMAEFRVDPRSGEPKLMELNPRLWGSLALSVFAGVDFPYLLYRLSTDGELPSTVSYRRGVQARCLFTDFIQVLQREDTIRATREFLTPASKPCCFDIVSRDDPLPMVGQTLYWSSLLLGD